MSKKTLQERMAEMQPYFKGIEMYNEALIVKVKFPQKWNAYNSADGRIKVTPSETTANEMFYFADSKDTTYDDIFDLVEETIKANNEIVLKVKLLRDKVEELRELFSNLTYDELTTLRFVTDSVKTAKPKRKYTKKEKTPQNENKEALEVMEAPIEETENKTEENVTENE